MNFGNLRIRFFKLVGSIEQYGKNHYKKKEHNQHISVLQVSHYLNVKDPLIIPLIFIILSCCEEAYDSKKWS